MNPTQQNFQYKGLFEAHISVAPLSKTQGEAFQHFCEKHQCKAIQIVLSRGHRPIQPMSCSRHKGSLNAVKADVQQLAKHMQEAGFDVKRLKIEAYPGNQEIPQTEEEAKLHPPENYFEHHWKILLNDAPSLELLQVCESYKAHFSKNAFKKRADGLQEHFITLRRYAIGLKDMQHTCDTFQNNLHPLNISVLKAITEYCVFDDYVALDDAWLDTGAACLQCPTPCYDE